MPDITMCQVEDCPQKNKCYRALAQASYRQSYFADDPRKDSWHMPSECEYFVVLETDELKKVVKISQMPSGSIQMSSGSIGVFQEYTAHFGDADNDRIIRYRFPFLGKFRRRLLKFFGVFSVDKMRFVIRYGLFVFLVVFCSICLIRLLY